MAKPCLRRAIDQSLRSTVTKRWEIVMFGLDDTLGERTTTTPEEACEMLEEIANAYRTPEIPRMLRDCATVIRRLSAELAKEAP